MWSEAMDLREFLKKYGGGYDYEEWYDKESRGEPFEDWFFNRFIDSSPAIYVGSIYFGDNRYWGGLAVEVDGDRLVYIRFSDGVKQVKEYVSFRKDNGWMASGWWKYVAKPEDAEWIKNMLYKLRKEVK